MSSAERLIRHSNLLYRAISGSRFITTEVRRDTQRSTKDHREWQRTKLCITEETVKDPRGLYRKFQKTTLITLGDHSGPLKIKTKLKLNWHRLLDYPDEKLPFIVKIVSRAGFFIFNIISAWEKLLTSINFRIVYPKRVNLPHSPNVPQNYEIMK